MSNFVKNMEDYEKIMKDRTKMHRQSILELNLSYEELIDCTAQAAAAVDILNNTVQYLVAENTNLKAVVAREKLPIDDYDILKQNMIATFQTDSAYVSHVVNDVHKRKRTVNAQKGGMAKVNNDKDKKQEAKMAIKKHWEKWQEGLETYKNKSDFTRHMIKKYSSLEGEQVIPRWCREWENNLLNK
ncbi:hypothetical protein ELY21_13985 [Legionella sp. km535]|uniref:hypothetical protein n=1 Tax=Legionella sp. km535 TaxID=2498107 RepID=UPI000F8F0B0F|nr:hypothetical protein [Legionella sp. km535]RUR15817.1 hypothetical protein ELY21_13985 [Legionella sp. km535]